MTVLEWIYGTIALIGLVVAARALHRLRSRRKSISYEMQGTPACNDDFEDAEELLEFRQLAGASRVR
jgi:hypothetical protein